MRRLLAPAFLTTVSLAGGCTKKPVDDGNTHNPPPIFLEDARAPVLVDAGGPPLASAAAKKKRKRTAPANYDYGDRTGRPSSTKLLNPHDANGRSIHAMADDRCAVEVPFNGPLPTNRPTGWSPRSFEDVDCPAEMDDPAWDHCTSRMGVDPASLDCFCLPSGGNPPPPPRKVKCPANAREIAKKP